MLLIAAPVPATTHYVVPINPAAADPYTNWSTAGTSIIDVVNCAITGSAPRIVLVSNGVYVLTNQVTISSTVTVQSVNGRDVTIIDGNNQRRCVRLSAGSVLKGFTVRNGYTNDYGGGIRCNNSYVQNCRITANVCSNYWGGGICVGSSTISNCEVVANTNINSLAGGVYAEGNSLVVSCVIASNVVTNTAGGEARAGGMHAEDDTAVIDKCIIHDNLVLSSGYAYGGGVELTKGAVVRNSFIYSNRAKTGGGIFVYFSRGSIQNCTVVSNFADNGGGIATICQNAYTTYVENVISYFNIGGSHSNFYMYRPGWHESTGSYYVVNNCIASTNEFSTDASVAAGYYYANNIETDPRFENKDSNDFHVTLNSPCLNAGTNASWMSGTADLDGHSRIDRFSGIVDMGCYEYIPSGMKFDIR